MKKIFTDNHRDILIGVVVIVCLLLTSNLVTWFMPSTIVMITIAIFVAAFLLFAVLIWRERPRDEREAHILMWSDRLGFLVGASVLSIGLVIASVSHQSTTLLAVGLSVMVLAKLIGKYIHK